MTGQKQAPHWATAEWIASALRGYSYGAATLLAAGGILMLLATSAHRPLAKERDEIFGVTMCWMLVMAGIFNLGLSVYVCSRRHHISQGLATMWAAWVYVVYWIGIVVTRIPTPVRAIRLMAQKFMVVPATMQMYWMILIAFLGFGSILHVYISRQRAKQLETENFKTKWCRFRQRTASSSGSS
jgi:hypothetical protein